VPGINRTDSKHFEPRSYVAESFKYSLFFTINNLLIFRNMRKSISQKELGFISELELKKKYFFKRSDIKQHFTSSNEMGVYLHRLMKKKRVIKINRSKYFLIPIKAIGSKWSEHPFIIIDEMMDGKNYCITGKAAAHYWKLIDQLPYEYEVYSTKRQGSYKIFNAKIGVHRVRKLPKNVERKLEEHQFIIATKGVSKQWT